MSIEITGSGLAFPLRVNERGSSVFVTEKELINQSLGIILLQPTNERFFLPQFGTEIERFRYEPNDEVLESLLYTFIVEAIQKWEKRIQVIRIDFDKETDVNTINCTIAYKILGSVGQETFIFPFYREITY